MNWTELLKAEADVAYHATQGLLALVNEDQLDWKPTTGDNWLTMGQLLQHLTNACGKSMEGFVTGDWGMPPEAMENMENMPPEDMLPPAEKFPTATSVAAARSLLAEDRELAHRMIDEAGEERLANEVSTAPWDPRPMNLGRRLLDMVDHHKRHSSQLFYYMKLIGMDVNTMDLYGMRMEETA